MNLLYIFQYTNYVSIDTTPLIVGYYMLPFFGPTNQVIWHRQIGVLLAAHGDYTQISSQVNLVGTVT